MAYIDLTYSKTVKPYNYYSTFGASIGVRIQVWAVQIFMRGILPANLRNVDGSTGMLAWSFIVG